MNELQIFKNPEFGEIRTIVVDNKTYAVGADVAKALGYSRPSEAVTAHCKGTVKRRILTKGGKQQMNIIPEGDILRLIVNSKLPAAEKYERWVFDEVLPAIHRDGVYMTRNKAEEAKLQAQQDRARAMLLNAQNRTLKTLMQTINNKNLSPIAVEVFGLKSIQEVTGFNVGDMLPNCEKTYSATQIAQMYGVSANKIGKIANANNLKTDEYGITVMDKSPYSAKEVSAFRYNRKAVEKIGSLINIK